MRKIDTLRIKFSAPSAHFRIIHSNNPRRTYPIPPYSTVVGILANILGKKEAIDQLLSIPFELGVISRYGYITNEYTWLRNFNSKKHIQRFGSAENRRYQGGVEHPGGQIPVSIQVLNEVDVIIYVHHPDEHITELLVDNSSKPEKWLSHIHLGRSEDWAQIENLESIELLLSNGPPQLRSSRKYYQWMPDYKADDGRNLAWLSDDEAIEDYRKLFGKVQGNMVLVTTLYRTVGLRRSGKDSTKSVGEVPEIRDFNHIPARLFHGQVPWLTAGKYPELYCDPDVCIPVFLTTINPLEGRDIRSVR